MLFRLSVATFWLTYCHLTAAQVPFMHQCPEVKISPDFDLDAYMGIWYEYAKYPFIPEMWKKCMYAKYENTGNGTVSVVNSAINTLTELPSNVSGTAKVIAPGQLAVVFNKHQSPDRANYLVLGTDYASYALVYSCMNVTGFLHTKIVWILTRERQPKPEVIADAKKIMADNNLTEAFLQNTEQNDCPDPNSPTQNDNAISKADEPKVVEKTTTSTSKADESKVEETTTSNTRDPERHEPRQNQMSFGIYQQNCLVPTTV